MKNKIEDLRDHLFAELEDLRDRKVQFNPARTRAVVEVSQAIINSAKVEVDFINATGIAKGSDFIPVEPRPPKPLAIEGESSRPGVAQLPVGRNRG